MTLYVGTSGYSYKEWKGSFYPEKIPAKDMLRYYGERLSTVEINATFYRMPQQSHGTRRQAEQIGDELPLFGPDGLGLDSIDALELVVSMEKTFGVGVPNSDVAGKALRTVNTIHDYILEKRAAAA